MAFSLTGLEQWTTWILLGLLAVWDLIAVLCPFGPLKLLIESSKRQQRDVPALLYSVNAVWFMMASTEHMQSPREDGFMRLEEPALHKDTEEERTGLKLGLGDFVFYSVLVARAAMFDWITTVCCTIAVLTGLTATIFLLAIYQKALPALPISIAFGMLFYFVAKTVLVPFVANICIFGMIGL
ncbi:Presenilin-domain-containing protein [Sporodiniella umbellata]|nr:Presenilin-domain-containing protein [Sporodiniella umbellata]